jgi:hypothetical protein
MIAGQRAGTRQTNDQPAQTPDSPPSHEESRFWSSRKEERKFPVMRRPRKYPQELIDRGVRLAIESGRPVAHVAAEIGLPAETLRRRVR